MKKVLLIFTVFVAANVAVRAQTVAQDWTKPDCAGNSHSLFADYLDSSKVVLMEFGMGCSTCGIAGQYFQQLRDVYAVSHPGQFKYFYMDYWVSNNCSPEVVSFLASYTLTPDASFDHCLSEMNYYMTGSPMPGYVIVAGPYHAVYLEKNYFNNSDTVLIHSTIDQALADMANVSVVEKMEESVVSVYPNPAGNVLNLVLPGQSGNVKVELFDATGKVVSQYSFYETGSKTMNQTIQTSSLSEGLYTVRAEFSGKTVVIQIQIIH